MAMSDEMKNRKSSGVRVSRARAKINPPYGAWPAGMTKRGRTIMETNVQNPTPSAATDPSPLPITPEDLVTQLRAFRDRIPEYGQLTASERVNKRRAASLKTGFVVASINAV